ncbi:hypothetical protein BJF83_14765 [Nocardiopsis sp. CNR-923]|uniref:hypothetical protein n=1 Tax=Nocardiopsis sp. CNR-923 TaxID=1904965 RepID=UPI000966F8A6|nr:hypothetical protein [Nocardiopsis sp. CNR-923]OLT28640.1 hypothetical protein BJF83_14765 [Nocardiopsis sp. CNR-923]
MRRSLALMSAVCLMAVSACDDSSTGSDDPPETVEDIAEQGLTGLALLHRGYEGADPETDQVLVFHDPATGQPVHEVGLPEGAVDPMASSVPVHAQFSADWRFFAYATADPSTVTVAALTDPEDVGAAERISYRPVESVAAAPGEELSRPVIHGERLWYVSDDPQDGQPPRVMSVPLDAPGGTPNQEGTLPLGDYQVPSDWALTPAGELHIRDSVRTEQMTGANGGALVVRRTGGTVVNASLTTGGEQWQTYDDALVWGEGGAVLGSAPTEAEPLGGAYLVRVEGQAFTATRLLEEGGPVLQHAPSQERDAVLLQTEEAWFRVDLAEDGVAGTEEVFPRFHDASMAGYPLVVRWAARPPEDAPSAGPSD